MSSPVLTLREKSPAFEALIEMVSRSIHHLPAVDEGGTAVGVVTTTDLVRLENSNPVYLAADIGRQRTMAGVVDQARRIPRVLGQLVERDVSAAEGQSCGHRAGRRSTASRLALAEAELGDPPAPYASLVLGSVAREEEALSADQDHALVLAEPDDGEWFARLAERFSGVLVECGWPRCPGQVMATNPRWRLTVDQWHQQFAAWSADSPPPKRE